MKLNGQKISGPNVETIVIPRGDGPPIVFKAQAVLDLEEFNKLCPEPKPPSVVRKGGVRDFDYKDAAYQKSLGERGTRQHAWMILKSLEATPGLEWETVSLTDPNSWLQWEDELKAAGFSGFEIGRIVRGVFAANCLDEAKLEEARSRFLASEEVAQGT